MFKNLQFELRTLKIRSFILSLTSGKWSIFRPSCSACIIWHDMNGTPNVQQYEVIRRTRVDRVLNPLCEVVKPLREVVNPLCEVQCLLY